MFSEGLVSYPKGFLIIPRPYFGEQELWPKYVLPKLFGHVEQPNVGQKWLVRFCMCMYVYVYVYVYVYMYVHVYVYMYVYVYVYVWV